MQGYCFISKINKHPFVLSFWILIMPLQVPPYFTVAERQAVIDSAQIAELNCLKVINETTAIGLGYGLFRQGSFNDKPRNVVFVDLGHSKLSVYIIAFTKKNFKVSTDMEFTLFRFLHNIGISILEGEIWIES